MKQAASASFATAVLRAEVMVEQILMKTRPSPQ
jgi:hypothetical protein